MCEHHGLNPALLKSRDFSRRNVLKATGAAALTGSHTVETGSHGSQPFTGSAWRRCSPAPRPRSRRLQA